MAENRALVYNNEELILPIDVDVGSFGPGRCTPSARQPYKRNPRFSRIQPAIQSWVSLCLNNFYTRPPVFLFN
jgi:hypothetical protein